MKIPAELLKQAIAKIGDDCTETECPFEDAVRANGAELKDIFNEAVARSLVLGIPAQYLIFSDALHIGYQLGKMTAVAADPTKSN